MTTLLPRHDLIDAITDTLNHIRSRRKPLCRYGSLSTPPAAEVQPLRRRFRRALTASATTLDLDVLNDLMRLYRKITKDTGKTQGLEPRIQLALELLPACIEKKPPMSPDHVVWHFNEIYKELGKVV